MRKYLIKRAVQIAVTLSIFHALLFFLIVAQPADHVLPKIGSDVPPEEMVRLQEFFGLNKSPVERYLLYVKNTFTGNLGTSYTLYPRHVSDVIKERLPRTIALFATATVLSFYMGFMLGKIIAWKRGGIVEHSATIGGVALYTMFTPFIALMMIWFFAFKLGWFPIGKFLDPRIWGDASVDANTIFNRMILTAIAIGATALIAYVAGCRMRLRWKGWIFPASLSTVAILALLIWNASGVGYLAVDIISHMVLPVITLTVISFAGTMLLTRTSMLETMREDYVVAARAKGLPDDQVRDRHVAKNALLPVITSFIFSMAFAIDGGVVIESIFSWPGMGMTLVESVQGSDVPLAVGAFAFIGVFALTAHLVADIVYVFLDPRIRY